MACCVESILGACRSRVCWCHACRHFKHTQQSLAQFLLERQQPALSTSPAASSHAVSPVSGGLPDVSETTPLVAEVQTAIPHMLCLS
jgi:hypothetical protein